MVRSEGLAQHRQVPQGHLAVQPTSTAEKNAPRRDSLTRRRRRKLRRSAADFAKIVQRGLGTNFPNKRKVAPSHLLCRIYAALSRSLLSAGEDTLQSSARFQPFFLPPNRYACIHTNILFCVGQQDIAKTIAHAEGFIIFWGRAGTICVCPPCLPKSAAGGGSQWREAFILTIDGRRLLRYDPFQSAGHRTISVAAAQITLSAAPSRGIDVQPFRCYNKSTISDTRHHADADGLKGLTGGCIFIFR